FHCFFRISNLPFYKHQQFPEQFSKYKLMAHPYEQANKLFSQKTFQFQTDIKTQIQLDFLLNSIKQPLNKHLLLSHLKFNKLIHDYLQQQDKAKMFFLNNYYLVLICHFQLINLKLIIIFLPTFDILPSYNHQALNIIIPSLLLAFIIQKFPKILSQPKILEPLIQNNPYNQNLSQRKKVSSNFKQKAYSSLYKLEYFSLFSQSKNKQSFQDIFPIYPLSSYIQSRFFSIFPYHRHMQQTVLLFRTKRGLNQLSDCHYQQAK
ncbi:hypothetical protein IMG5_094960, partial [Ichthyophthirius multifiliis]